MVDNIKRGSRAAMDALDRSDPRAVAGARVVQAIRESIARLNEHPLAAEYVSRAVKEATSVPCVLEVTIKGELGLPSRKFSIDHLALAPRLPSEGQRMAAPRTLGLIGIDTERVGRLELFDAEGRPQFSPTEVDLDALTNAVEAVLTRFAAHVDAETAEAARDR